MAQSLNLGAQGKREPNKPSALAERPLNLISQHPHVPCQVVHKASCIVHSRGQSQYERLLFLV